MPSTRASAGNSIPARNCIKTVYRPAVEQPTAGPRVDLELIEKAHLFLLPLREPIPARGIFHEFQIPQLQLAPIEIPAIMRIRGLADRT